jgi:hypothetical protein
MGLVVSNFAVHDVRGRDSCGVVFGVLLWRAARCKIYPRGAEIKRRCANIRRFLTF